MSGTLSLYDSLLFRSDEVHIAQDLDAGVDLFLGQAAFIHCHQGELDLIAFIQRVDDHFRLVGQLRDQQLGAMLGLTVGNLEIAFMIRIRVTFFSLRQRQYTPRTG